jgi:hypothetical protein
MARRRRQQWVWFRLWFSCKPVLISFFGLFSNENSEFELKSMSWFISNNYGVWTNSITHRKCHPRARQLYAQLALMCICATIDTTPPRAPNCHATGGPFLSSTTNNAPMS